MKLNSGFIVYCTGSDVMLVPRSNNVFAGVVKGNETTGFIFDALKTETTKEEIIAKMINEFDAPENVIASSVESVLLQLREIHALDE